MTPPSRPSRDEDLIEELDRLGYRELAEVFLRLYPDCDPYEIIKVVLASLDEQQRLFKQTQH